MVFDTELSSFGEPVWVLSPGWSVTEEASIRGEGSTSNAELPVTAIRCVSFPRDIQPQCRFIVRSVKIKNNTGLENSLSGQNHLVSES